jgi:hypothetical protein
MAHGTFEAYCLERWGFKRNYANKLIAAAEVGTIVPNLNEGQARELAPLIKQDEQAAIEVYRELKKEYGDDVTAKRIKTWSVLALSDCVLDSPLHATFKKNC